MTDHTVFDDFRSRRAARTTARHARDLAHFGRYLEACALPGGDLAQGEAWQHVTGDHVAGYVRYLVGQGYAVGTVNLRLATVKTFAKLCMKAGALSPDTYAMIRAVDGYSHREGLRLDEKRQAENIPTRRGHKKAQPVILTPAQAATLKDAPDTPQGRRDRLMLCLLLDHGLRCGEVARLKVADIDLAAGVLRFFRPKVSKNQTHRLSPDTLRAARAYLKHDPQGAGESLVKVSERGGGLGLAGMRERGITKRVALLGVALGVVGLSAHDLRHFWATQAARNGTPIDRLQDAGGWSSPYMPLRYVQAAKVANDGVRMGEGGGGAGEGVL